MKKFALLTALVLWSGCGESKLVVHLNDDGPLTVEQWSELDVLVEYEFETFERLQKTNPKLKQEAKLG